MKLVSNVIGEKQLRSAQLRALELFANTLKGTYGPMGEYTAYSYRDTNKNTKLVVSNYTKDGFTVLKHIDLDKPIEDILKDDIRTICTQVIKSIGDGTTSAVIMSYLIFKGLLELQQKGLPKRKIVSVFKEMIKEGIDIIESRGHEATLEDIYNIAYTSLNGNSEVANIIKSIYEESGMDVFIDVSASNTPETKTKTYNGMTYEEGFIDPCFATNEKTSSCDLVNPNVYVFESPIDTPEMVNLFRLIVHAEYLEPIRKATEKVNMGKEIKESDMPVPTLIICPTISRDMNSFLDEIITAMTNMPPDKRGYLCVVANIDNDNNYLMDIMKMTGAKFIKKYIDPKNYEEDKKKGLAPTEFNIKTFAGKAEHVTVDATSTKIINPKNMYDENGKYTEFFENYLANLESTLAKYETTRQELVKIGRLKRRINILKTNMVDLYVGGIGTSDRMPLLDAIEDAVLNCRSAAKDGVSNGANFEGLKAFSVLEGKYNKESEETHEVIKKEVSRVLREAYLELCSLIYLPYFDEDKDKALSCISESLLVKNLPFNIISEEYDGKVLTSVKTEPAILDSISRIITLLFQTNQFLVPDARFNIYDMESESSSVPVINTDGTTAVHMTDI